MIFVYVWELRSRFASCWLPVLPSVTAHFLPRLLQTEGSKLNIQLLRFWGAVVVTLDCMGLMRQWGDLPFFSDPMFPAASGCGPCCPWLSDLCAFPFKIYVHLKEGGGPDGLDALKNKPQLHSMVARSLCRNAAGKNYIIFTGPSITSLTLFEEFEKQGLSSGRPSMAGSLGKW